MKIKFYSLKEILKLDATYNMIFGERSNGKTYSVLEYALKNYIEKGEQLAIIRRWEEDYRGKRAHIIWDGIVANGLIEELTDGEFNDVVYRAGQWFLGIRDEKTNAWVTSDTPIAYAFALTATEHDKSTSYPHVTTILFDEFLTRGMYLPDEFVSFMNQISTIVRYRNNVKIFMLGNTVNKYSPYFKEMGISHIKEMKQGDIDFYRVGDSELTIAVEWADNLNKKGKPSDKYFAFDNPKLSMITGGAWEMAVYPHLPFKYKQSDIIFTYFICFEDDILQCEIVNSDNMLFTYIHRKTTPLKNEDEDLVYTTDYSPRPNFSRKITKPRNELERKIAKFFVEDKVFYQDNEIGEIVRNYINWCANTKIK